jgi:hypothetical protein
MSDRRLESLHFQFLVFERRNQTPYKSHGLFFLRRGGESQLQMAMRLELGRFIAEGALDAFAKLEFSARQGALKIRESLSAEVFEFWEKSLQLFNLLGKVVDRLRFRPRPLRSCTCHTVGKV